MAVPIGLLAETLLEMRNNMENFTVDYFIKKFEAIPEEKWMVGEFKDNEGRFCALGHCGQRMGMSCNEIPDESWTLRSLFAWTMNRFSVTNINDGKDYNYQQPTPKQRVLAALYDVKNKKL